MGNRVTTEKFSSTDSYDGPFWGIYRIKSVPQYIPRERVAYVLLDFTRNFEEAYSKAIELSRKFPTEVILSHVSDEELQSQKSCVSNKVTVARFFQGEQTFADENLLGPVLC